MFVLEYPSQSVSVFGGEFQDDVGVGMYVLLKCDSGLGSDTGVLVLQCLDKHGDNFRFSALTECFQCGFAEPRARDGTADIIGRHLEKRLEGFRVSDFRERFHDGFPIGVAFFRVEKCFYECIDTVRVVLCSECLQGSVSDSPAFTVIVQSLDECLCGARVVIFAERVYGGSANTI